MAIFSSTEIHTPHTNKTQATESILHKNQHAVTYRVKKNPQNCPPAEQGSLLQEWRKTWAFSGGLPGGGEGVSRFGCLHLQPFNFRKSPKGDNEHFSVNCPFCVSLAASSPSPASAEIPGPPETRTSLRATAPRANAAGKLPIPTPGKSTARGQLGEAGAREEWREGEGAQTHRGRSNRLQPAP